MAASRRRIVSKLHVFGLNSIPSGPKATRTASQRPFFLSRRDKGESLFASPPARISRVCVDFLQVFVTPVSNLPREVSENEDSMTKYILVSGGVISGIGKGVIGSCSAAITSIALVP